MQFLVLSRRRTDQFSNADFERLVPSEGAQARHLYSIGFTRQIWHRGDVPGACQVVEAKDEGEVHETLATLPLARAGMLDFEIVPLKPYAGFSLLLSPSVPRRLWREASWLGQPTVTYYG